jgi:hypothetical protein
MTVNPQFARSFAYSRHLDQRDRSGDPIVAHLERVAAAVPEDARNVAFLHDVLEHTEASSHELEAQGLTPAELDAVLLLTRAPEESFEAHALRIAHAKGPAGWLARTVKLADMADHVSHDRVDLPCHPYGWATRHVLAGQERTDRPAAMRPSSRTAPQGVAGMVAAGDAPGC